MILIACELPIRVPSRANLREHWAARARRDRQQRSAARLIVGSWLHMRSIYEVPAGPVTVRLTRRSPRALDTDNLAGSLKSVRDGVADALGRTDGPESGITWEYAQARASEQSVRVEIATGAAP